MVEIIETRVFDFETVCTFVTSLVLEDNAEWDTFVIDTKYRGTRKYDEIFRFLNEKQPQYVYQHYNEYGRLFVDEFDDLLDMTTCYYDEDSDKYVDFEEYTREIDVPFVYRDNRFFVRRVYRDGTYKTELGDYHSGRQLFDQFRRMAIPWGMWGTASVKVIDESGKRWLMFTFDNYNMGGKRAGTYSRYNFKVLPLDAGVSFGWFR